VSNTNGNGRNEATSRRQVLKGAAAVAGAAIGSGAVRGFPTIWAQNVKDITLRHVGGPWAVIKEIGIQASKDLGFTLEMQTTDIPAEIQRALTQPQSIDIFQSEETTNKYLEHAGVFKPIHVKDYKLWDKTLPMFTEGKFPDGRPIPNIGMSPMKAGFWTGPDAKKFADHRTEWLVMLPTLFNADTLGIRPDLVGGEDKVTSWGDLLDPKYKGKSSLCSLAIVGVTDAAMALQARGEMKYGDIGNMTRAEIDKTFEIMDKIKDSGFFRAFWGGFDESVNLMAGGEVVIQSMISPAVTAVKARGIPCYYAPLKEGYRAWTNGIVPMAHLRGLKLDCAMEYINWYNSGWQGGFIAKQGYYSPVPETAKKFLTPEEWDYWYEGKPAAIDMKDPYGNLEAKKGEVRDGGSLWEREGRISVWNTVMDEDRYMTRRWNEFIAG
jgi:putative spermidine/putrescine transport system substrate-binding protein